MQDGVSTFDGDHRDFRDGPGPRQDQTTGALLLKTGLLGMGAEPGAYSKEPMLDSPAVLKALKVTEAQIGRLKKARIESDRISERIGRENRALQRQFTAQGNQEGLAELERANWKLVFSLTKESERPLLQVLDSGQRSRLEQLQLQADGPYAFIRPEVQDRLRMSAEQVEAVKAIFEQGRQAIAQSATLPAGAKPVARGLPPSKRVELLKSKDFAYQVENVRKQIVTARGSTMRGIAEFLNKNQRATFEKMLGEPFEFPKIPDRQPLSDRTAGAAENGRGPS